MMSGIPPRTILTCPKGGNWTSIASIAIEFEEVPDSPIQSAKGMNLKYVGELQNFEDIFTDSSRTALKEDAIDILFDRIATHITSVAIQTTQSARISPIVRTWKLRYQFHKRQRRQLGTYGGVNTMLGTFLSRTTASNESDPTIYVDFSQMHIDTTQPRITYLNFDHFSMAPFSVAPSIVSTGYGSNILTFDPVSLPPTIKDRYNLFMDEGKHIRTCDLLPFKTTGIDAQYHQDTYTGNVYVLRNGQTFALARGNAKELLRHYPQCMDTSGSGVRHWYRLLGEHCARHGFYIHPYCLFTKGHGGNIGFTSGSNPSDDLPGRFYVTQKITKRIRTFIGAKSKYLLLLQSPQWSKNEQMRDG